MTTRRTLLATGLGLAAAPALATPALAGAPAARPAGAAFPTLLPLPDGFQPEGIAIDQRSARAYFGSLANGDILRVDLANGHSRIISTGPGTPSVGMRLDPHGRLFVSGGPAGTARVVSVATGAVLATYPFATGTTFINDVALTPAGAYFTDSSNAALYHVPLRHHGALPPPSAVQTVPLSGDFVQQAGFNANGITPTPDGSALLVVQSNTATLFRVNPHTGVARTVDLGGAALTNGDGMRLSGHTLFVVQNRNNNVAVIRLNHAGTAGTVVAGITDPRFDVPTGADTFGDRLYLPNARFGTTPTPTTTYTAVAVRRH